jgi:hypothetical protein
MRISPYTPAGPECPPARIRDPQKYSFENHTSASTRRHRQDPPLAGYQQLCRELAVAGPGTFGELDTTAARSVLRRYSDAWFAAAKRRKAGDLSARYPGGRLVGTSPPRETTITRGVARHRGEEPASPPDNPDEHADRCTSFPRRHLPDGHLTLSFLTVGRS